MHKYFNLDTEETFTTLKSPQDLPEEYKLLLPEYINSTIEFPENINMLSDCIVGFEADIDFIQNDLKNVKEISGDFFDDITETNFNTSLNTKTSSEFSSANKLSSTNKLTKVNKPQSFNNSNTNKKEKIELNSDSTIDEILINHPEYSNLASSLIKDSSTTFDSIAGLPHVKNLINELIIWPLSNPSLFTGLRNPPNTLLLFGPPGTGKTLLGKAIASETNAFFFSISASTIMSKFIGEAEKAVKNLYEFSNLLTELKNESVVIFIDEIDSLLSARSSEEHESSRRLKTEFLVCLEGLGKANSKILTVGATNRPYEIDDAARRRFIKRVYVPLPDKEGRHSLVEKLITQTENTVSKSQIEEISNRTEGYSGSDMYNLVREAVMNPVRELFRNSKDKTIKQKARSVEFKDFLDAINKVKRSVETKDLKVFEDWNERFGSFS